MGRPSRWVWPLLALAFGLRVWGLSDLQVSGDAAWSVYLALKELPELTRATAMDSHPPLYYYLLHGWSLAAGLTELSVRLSSSFTGLLTVALTYKLGQRLLGRGGGLLAGALAAISPFLVYFDRMPRMYSLLALLTTLSLYLILRLLARPSALQLGLYLTVILAALYTHYYGVQIMAAGFLVVAAGWRQEPRLLMAWLGGHGLVFILFLPWLLYILAPFVATTTQEYGTMGLAPPSHLLAFLERFWIALNMGDMWEVGQSRLLTLGLSLLWPAGLSAAFLWPKKAHLSPERLPLLAPATFVAMPLLANSLVFLLSPYVPFTRLMLVAAPAYLLLLAWLLGELWRAYRPGAALGMALAVASLAYALAGTLYVEGRSADLEAVEATRRMGPLAGKEDGVIFQAPWHGGYFKLHSGGEAAAAHALAEVPPADLPGLLERHPRLWLFMYSSGKREALYPQEEWLDRHAYKAQEYWRGRLRLSLYAGGADPVLRPVGAVFGGLIGLEEAGVGPYQVRPGEVVKLLLRWRPLQEIGRKYVVFVHLVGADGRGCTGRDGEPLDGLSPTETWKAGETIEDRRGLLVEQGVPPGQYYLALGLYPREDPAQRLALPGAEGDKLLLGPLQVLAPSPLPPRERPLASGAGLEVLGYRVEPEWEAQVVKNVDGPVEVWSAARPRPGGRISVTLRWRAEQPLGEAYALRLEMVDGAGRAWGQAPAGTLGGACPTFRWAPGEVISETREMAILPEAPPGQYRLRATLYSPSGGPPLVDPILFGSLRISGP